MMKTENCMSCGFENAESVKAKLNLAKKMVLGGVTFWHIGGEDPEIWNAVQ